MLRETCRRDMSRLTGSLSWTGWSKTFLVEPGTAGDGKRLQEPPGTMVTVLPSGPDETGADKLHLGPSRPTSSIAFGTRMTRQLGGMTLMQEWTKKKMFQGGTYSTVTTLRKGSNH